MALVFNSVFQSWLSASYQQSSVGLPATRPASGHSGVMNELPVLGSDEVTTSGHLWVLVAVGLGCRQFDNPVRFEAFR